MKNIADLGSSKGGIILPDWEGKVPELTSKGLPDNEVPNKKFTSSTTLPDNIVGAVSNLQVKLPENE